MATTPRKPVAKSNRERSALRDAFAADMAELKTTVDERRESGTHETRTRSTGRDEYRDALADLNRYSAENETTEAQAARDRFDRAAAKRHWWNR